MENPTPTPPDTEAISVPEETEKTDETSRLVKVTNALLSRASKLETELIALHSAQVNMASDVGYIRGAVDLLVQRVDHIMKNGNGKGENKGSETTTHTHSETIPKK